jgi:hypothetical protein
MTIWGGVGALLSALQQLRRRERAIPSLTHRCGFTCRGYRKRVDTAREPLHGRDADAMRFAMPHTPSPCRLAGAYAPPSQAVN